MKRYGFKFHDPDGTHANAVELRYFSIGGGILFGFITGMFNPAQGAIMLASIPVFWLLSFLIEGWPKLFYIVIAIVGLTIFSLSIMTVFKMMDRNQLDLIVGVVLSLIYYSVYIVIGVRDHGEHNAE